MRTEHRLFAHHYIISGDKEKAYSIVYPNASGESLKVNARRLLRRKEIREFVDRELTANAQLVLAARLAEQERRIAEEYATLDLARRKLRAIIMGEHKVKRYFKYKNHIEVVEEECSPFAVLRAIDTDRKLVQQFFALKNAEAGGKNTSDKNPPPLGGVRGGGASRDRGYSLPLPPMSEGHNIPRHLQLQEMIKMGQEEFFDKHYGPDFAPALRAREIKERPWMEQIYKERGERVLDYIPSEDEFLAMQGVHAYNKKLELARREEAKRLRESGQGIPGNPDGTVDIPEIIPSTRDIDPMSIPELFPADEYTTPTDNPSPPPGEARGASSRSTDNTLSPAGGGGAIAPGVEHSHRTDNTNPPLGGARGASSRRTDNTSERAGSLTTYKIIVTNPETGQNDLSHRDGGTNEENDPALPPELLANPFFKQPDPSLKGKINPMAFTRETVRKQYTPAEIHEILAKEWEQCISNPDSVFNNPDSEYYIPPERRGPGGSNPFLFPSSDNT
ncbi:MAG: hypothetical protein H3C54_03855 [Taibaiella sp.]|nr:hypothetical protein [Taibaiella sp.]